MNIYKASSKWLSKIMDCSLSGIQNGCSGYCCRSNFYPSTILEHNIFNKCHWLEIGNGCKLKMSDQPVLCLLYPIIINENRTLILFARSLFQSCKENYKKGEKSIIENQKPQLINIFGESFYNHLYKSIIIDKEDFYFYMPEYVENCIRLENYLETIKEIPIKRSQYKKKYPEFFNNKTTFNIISHKKSLKEIITKNE